MKSDKYKNEKARARKLDPGNAEAVKEKQRKRKLIVYSLRHQMRRMKAIDAKKARGRMSKKQERQYERWCSGAMDREVEALTKEHGYGKLPSDESMLLPTRFPDTILRQRSYPVV